MKAIKIISHPYLLILSFIVILISGENWGGFYILYLLLGLPHGGLHSILALLGIGLLVFSYGKYGGNRKYLVAPVFNITGDLLLLASLFFFFYSDKEHYNYGTFYQAVPVIMLSIFCLLAVWFFLDNLFALSSRKKEKQLTL
jgi:hypothetical protein